ncbi:MAG: pyridoxamine 5'-phosphate oxidase family protein [Lachnospiraceae bacterium]|nr:pyridoxamine 5'-phosphate oxidase family protein [Lachnospiraceae bacterium]
MENVLQFLNDAKTFYLATSEDGQPHVRPFGAACIIDGKLCIMTNTQKNVFKQIQKNPKIEISGMANGKWLRLQAEANFDDRREVRVAMLEAHPELSNMYSVDDGIMAVLALTNATAQICSFTDEPETIKF